MSNLVEVSSGIVRETLEHLRRAGSNERELVIAWHGKRGVAGIIVSNHGARNLDTVPATIDALPRIVARVEGRVPVIVDGGIRRGTDVIKALALGANAVQVGRPYLWGLGVAGAEGVTRVVEILRKELELAMALMGRPTVKSIERSALWD